TPHGRRHGNRIGLSFLRERELILVLESLPENLTKRLSPDRMIGAYLSRLRRLPTARADGYDPCGRRQGNYEADLNIAIPEARPRPAPCDVDSTRNSPATAPIHSLRLSTFC